MALALTIFPVDFLWPATMPAHAPQGDAAQHAIAQRYFIQDAWHWPPLIAHSLLPPDGLNIAFADGIPLLALLLKAGAAILPAGFHGIGLWHALVFMAQPMAAIWCLKGAGEQRWLPSLAIGLMALSMPAFLNRYGHAALMGHFTLFLSLGLYLRLVREQRLSLWGWAGSILLATLLVHPYLAAMMLALLGAVPLTLLLRGDPAWRGALAGMALVLVALGGFMVALGYLGAQGDGGYGHFALNLFSPIWPHLSGILPGLVTTEIDATGHGGWEGYNWLGAGLILALILAFALGPRQGFSMIKRHAGLALVLGGLSLLALSFQIGAGDQIILDLGDAPGFLQQFRASGRFFWPVGVALMMGASLLLVRLTQRRLGVALLGLLALLQFLDAAPIRAAMAAWAAQRAEWRVDAPALRPVLRGASRLVLLPSWPCVPPGDPAREHALQLEILSLASETALPANTMYVARWRVRPGCEDAANLAAPPMAGEVRLALPSAAAALRMASLGQGLQCRELGEILACQAPR